MKVNVCTLYYRTPEDGQLYGIKYHITESTEKGWQARLHVVRNTCVKLSFLGRI